MDTSRVAVRVCRVVRGEGLLKGIHKSSLRVLVRGFRA